jgi:hypothetical protein
MDGVNLMVVSATLPLDDEAQAELTAARRTLQNPGNLVVRAADLLGRTAGGAGARLLGNLMPNMDSGFLTDIAQKALTRAYDVVVLGLNVPGPPPRASAPLVAASGFGFGLAGFAGFLPDATFTTMMILREIVRVAQDSGEDLATEESRAACLAVFSLRAGDEAGYFSSRFLLEGTAARGLLARAATVWGAVLGEKFAAQAVPLAGALAGAALNAAFLDHYRRLAQAHFTIRRLRRVYGNDAVEAVPHVEDETFMEQG